MKKIAIFLTIMALHHSAYALDVLDNILSYFTDDPKYTIDKRKYVSRDNAPFSAVVGLYYSGKSNFCSGTLTSDGVIVTAKHCIVGKGDNSYTPLTQIHINYKADSNVAVNYRLSPTADVWNSDGSHNYSDASAPFHDWAFLVPQKDIKSIVQVSKLTGKGTSDVIVAGYGALKILSDQEIRKIRQEYAKWLNSQEGMGYHESTLFGTDLNIFSSTGYAFFSEIYNGLIPGIASDTFKDTDKLKASYCRVTASDTEYNEIGCQLWGGNSGGSVFYKYNNKWYLYGVTVNGLSTITNNRDTYARGAHMVPVNRFFTYYKNLISKLKDINKKGNTNEN